jgi:hypothetical protein
VDRAPSREEALKAAIAALQAATAALQYVAQPVAPAAVPQEANLSVAPIAHEPVVPPEPVVVPPEPVVVPPEPAAN